MKKSAVKNSLVVVVIIGIFLTAIGLLLHYSMPWPSMPSFNFLKGREPAYHCIISQSGKKIIQDIYSFEADFDEVFPEANKELLALGIRNDSIELQVKMKEKENRTEVTIGFPD